MHIQPTSAGPGKSTAIRPGEIRGYYKRPGAKARSGWQ